MGVDLVVTESNTKLSLNGEKLLLTREGKTFLEIKLQDLEKVILFGNVEMTAPVRRALLKRRMDTLFFSSTGKFEGRLLPPLSPNAELRLQQYAFASDKEKSLMLARSFVKGKLTNQYRLLLRHQRRLQSEALAGKLAQLRHAIQKTEKATSREELLGIEGQAARTYFQGFSLCIKKPEFAMQGRTKRPPKDPVNALLSFGYTVLGAMIEDAVWRTGLDPSLGFFHTPHHGRPSLALDLLEEFRPLIIDSLTLSLINLGSLRRHDFFYPDEAREAERLLLEEEGEIEKNRACYLAETGRKIFFHYFYKKLRSCIQYAQWGELELKGILQQQSYHLARVIKGEEEAYLPFTPR